MVRSPISIEKGTKKDKSIMTSITNVLLCCMCVIEGKGFDNER